MPGSADPATTARLIIGNTDIEMPMRPGTVGRDVIDVTNLYRHAGAAGRHHVRGVAPTCNIT
jgi:hypothetical protein